MLSINLVLTGWLLKKLFVNSVISIEVFFVCFICDSFVEIYSCYLLLAAALEF